MPPAELTWANLFIAQDVGFLVYKCVVIGENSEVSGSRNFLYILSITKNFRFLILELPSTLPVWEPANQIHYLGTIQNYQSNEADSHLLDVKTITDPLVTIVLLLLGLSSWRLTRVISHILKGLLTRACLDLDQDDKGVHKLCVLLNFFPYPDLLLTSQINLCPLFLRPGRTLHLIPSSLLFWEDY